ncbi:hypothetical protein J6590_005562 [Homalodisca vitripennis]|nr:hypothetical protein J6590_005562 [Homalodisca vitripennis]
MILSMMQYHTSDSYVSLNAVCGLRTGHHQHNTRRWRMMLSMMQYHTSGSHVSPQRCMRSAYCIIHLALTSRLNAVCGLRTGHYQHNTRRWRMMLSMMQYHTSGSHVSPQRCMRSAYCIIHLALTSRLNAVCGLRTGHYQHNTRRWRMMLSMMQYHTSGSHVSPQRCMRNAYSIMHLALTSRLNAVCGLRTGHYQHNTRRWRMMLSMMQYHTSGSHVSPQRCMRSAYWSLRCCLKV